MVTIMNGHLQQKQPETVQIQTESQKEEATADCEGHDRLKTVNNNKCDRRRNFLCCQSCCCRQKRRFVQQRSSPPLGYQRKNESAPLFNSPNEPSSVVKLSRSTSTNSSLSCSSSNSSITSDVDPSPLPYHRRRRNALISRNNTKAYCQLLKDNTTFHGIRDTVQTAGCLRFVWLTIIVLATLAALVGCALIVWEYNTRPLVVTYGIKEDVNLTLPDIVVCPFNRFNRTFFQSHNVSAQLAQYLELAFPSPAQHPFQYHQYKQMISPNRLDQLEIELDALLASIDLGSNNTVGKMSFTEFIKKSAIACEAFFVNPKTCDAAEEIMTSAGKCFRLAGVEQRSDGFGHGQRIILRLPKHLFNPGVNQMLNDGVVVKLAERGKGIDHDMSFVPSGVHAIFPLTATRFEFKNYPPHFKCREDDAGVYSRVWCFEDCFMAQAERDCNCSLAAASRPATPYICTTREFFHCVYPKLYSKGHEERIARCKSHCGPPCNYWRFDKTVTYSNFPSEQARHFVNDSSKWEELQNTIILDVYYITLDYTIIRHMLSMTPPSFVAQIGGQISLWIGGSIISVIQLVIYLSSALYAYLSRGRRWKNKEYQIERKTLNGRNGEREREEERGIEAKHPLAKKEEHRRRRRHSNGRAKTGNRLIKGKRAYDHDRTRNEEIVDNEMIFMSAKV